MEARQPTTPAPVRVGEPQPEKRLWLLCGLLLAAGVAALGVRTLGFDWLVFDDDINILFNPLLGGLGPHSLAAAFGDLEHMRRYLPLGYSLWDLQLELFGFSSTGFHLCSVFLAAGAAFVLFLCLRAFGRLLGLRGRTLEFSAFLAAGLWCFHPMRACSLAWISGQLYLGASLLAFLALHQLLRALGDGVSDSGRRLAWWLSGIAYLASLLVYPVYLALAPLGLLLAWWQLRRRCPGLAFRETAVRAGGLSACWLLGALLVGALNLYAAQHHQGGFGSLPGLESGSLAQRLLQSAAFLLALLGRSLWYGPSSPYLGESLDAAVFGAHWLLGGLVLCVLLAPLFTRAGRASRLWLLPLALLISVLPVCGLVDASTDPSDRYSMLPHLVLSFAFLVILAGSLRRRKLLFLAASLASVVFLALQQRALLPWANTRSLQAALDQASAQAGSGASRDRFFRLCFQRASLSLFYSGEVEEAQARLAQGLQRRPSDDSLLALQRVVDGLLHKDPRLGASPARRCLHELQHLQLAGQWEEQGNLRAAQWHRERAEQLRLQLTTELLLRRSSGNEAHGHPPAP
jgi:hypothetical protein